MIRHVSRGMIQRLLSVRFWLIILALSSLSGVPRLQAQNTVPAKVVEESPFGPELLTGRRIRAVFRKVVASSVKSTVELLADDERIALGTIVDSDGWILTKASQIRKANRVRLADGRQLPYQHIGYHQELDLALLKVDQKGLPAVEWSMEAPQTGSWLVTVGTRIDPLGVGVLSAPRRKIPRSDVHGYLGVELSRDASPRIRRVFPNSGASEAGLQAGDVVLAIDEHAIDSGEELIRTLQTYRPGDTLSVRIRRSDGEFAYSVTLMHPYGDFLSRMAFQNQMGGPLSSRRDNFEAVYQHDTVLDPRDCGGAVVNLDGRAIGINIARAGRTESYALPADLILPVLEEMKSGQFPPPENFSRLPGLISELSPTSE